MPARPPIKTEPNKLKQLTGTLCAATFGCAAVLLLLLAATVLEEYIAFHLLNTHETVFNHVQSYSSVSSAAAPVQKGLSTEEHLIEAAKNGNLTTVKRALHRMQIHDLHRHAVVDMALYYAAEFDHVDIVSHLLSREGVDPNEGHHKDGHTVLTIACSKGHADVVDLLLTKRGKRVNFNIKAKRGKTALIWAAIHGHDEVVKLLTAKKHRVNLELRDEHYKRTALMWATANHNSNIVDILLRAGADPHAKGAENPHLKRQYRAQHHVNAMHIAKHYEHHEAVQHLERHIQARTHTVPTSKEHAEALDRLRIATGQTKEKNSDGNERGNEL
jgi:hypothetical protein